MTGGGDGIRRLRNPRGSRTPKGYADDAVLSEEEVRRRVDLRAAAPDAVPVAPWIGEADARDTSSERQPESRADMQTAVAGAGAPTVVVTRSKLAQDDRRRQLWRDSATILIAVVLVLLAGQVFIPQQTAGPAGSPTPLPSQIAIGSLAPPPSLPPGATFGPIINPSLGVDASPTPIPVITMGPTPSPTPSIEPSPSLGASVKPSLKPSVKPSVKPTVRPTRTPTPTRTPSATRTPTPTAPPPDAQFTADITLLVVQFNNGSTGDTAWSWDFGDGSGTSNQENPTYTYTDPGTYSVTLTVTGPGGPASSITHNVTVPPSP